MVQTESSTYKLPGGVIFDTIAYSLAGRKAGTPKVNQDSFFVEGPKPTGNDPFPLVCAVLDGHGSAGEDCSLFVSDFFTDRIGALFTNGPGADFEGRVSKLFVEANTALRRVRHFDTELSGSTGTLAVLDPEAIRLSWVGDSRAILGSVTRGGGAVLAKCLTRDHKPQDPGEFHRIAKAGGRVARLLVDGQEQGPYRIWMATKTAPGLSMTRALGDGMAQTIGVIPDPEHLKHRIQPQDRYLLLCSDGCTEFMTEQEIMEAIHEVVHAGGDPEDAVRRVVLEAHSRWVSKEFGTADDCTAVLVLLNTQTAARDGKASRTNSTSAAVAKKNNALQFIGGSTRPQSKALASVTQPAAPKTPAASSSSHTPGAPPRPSGGSSGLPDPSVLALDDIIPTSPRGGKAETTNPSGPLFPGRSATSGSISPVRGPPGRFPSDRVAGTASGNGARNSPQPQPPSQPKQLLSGSSFRKVSFAVEQEENNGRFSFDSLSGPSRSGATGSHSHSGASSFLRKPSSSHGQNSGTPSPVPSMSGGVLPGQRQGLLSNALPMSMKAQVFAGTSTSEPAALRGSADNWTSDRTPPAGASGPEGLLLHPSPHLGGRSRSFGKPGEGDARSLLRRTNTSLYKSEGSITNQGGGGDLAWDSNKTPAVSEVVTPNARPGQLTRVHSHMPGMGAARITRASSRTALDVVGKDDPGPQSGGRTPLHSTALSSKVRGSFKH